MGTSDSSSPPEHTIQWDEVRACAAGVVRAQFQNADAALVGEIVQDTMVRLLRVVRNKMPNSVEAMVRVIAKRTTIDFLRKRKRWNLLVQPLTEDMDPPDPNADDPDAIGDPDERIRFTVLEFFHTHGSGCHALALAYFRGESWQRVADRLKQTHDQTRKQWSRCVAALKRAALADGGPLFEWANG